MTLAMLVISYHIMSSLLSPVQLVNVKLIPFSLVCCSVSLRFAQRKNTFNFYGMSVNISRRVLRFADVYFARKSICLLDCVGLPDSLLFSSDSNSNRPSTSSRSATSITSGWADVVNNPSFKTMTSLENLNFDNLVLLSLPLDPDRTNVVRQVSGAFFSIVKPRKVLEPVIVSFSESALALLDIDNTEGERADFAEYLSGNILLPGSEPAAHCYCGHQFGNFAGQLGDGAAMYLGEVVNQEGERWEIQLKGAGPTPYSRQADGRKVLRSSIREFLCSEAMHNLGIATTRAGSCVTSQTNVIRDVFYSGNPIEEKATLVLRIAPTFIRFGSFEIFKPIDPRTNRGGPSAGRYDLLEQLTNYVIKTFFPQIWQAHKGDKKRVYLEFYKEVVLRTARLVAEWQAVGWCHGVLNTDNMSIVGITIDYGPYGFMDRFDAGFVCNSSDSTGRYAYNKQPSICKWNCEKLAEALDPLINLQDTAECLELFDMEYENTYLSKMRKKLGLLKTQIPDDTHLISSLFETMEQTGCDFTNCFRCLSRLPLPGSHDLERHLEDVKEYLLSQCCSLQDLITANKPTMDPRQLQMFTALIQMNPNMLSQFPGGHKAISRQLDLMDKVKLLQGMTEVEKSQKDRTLWEEWLKKYSVRLCMESEAADDNEEANRQRVTVMNNNNPRFVLRNYIVQNAIESAEQGDYSEVRRVLKLLQTPYSDDAQLDDVTELITYVDTDDDVTQDNRGERPASSCMESMPQYPRSHSGIAYDSKPPLGAVPIRVT